MKKFWSYILIVLILTANILSPFSVSFNKNISVNKNVVSATTLKDDLEDKNLDVKVDATKDKITVDVTLNLVKTISSYNLQNERLAIVVHLKNPTTGEEINFHQVTTKKINDNKISGSVMFDDKKIKETPGFDYVVLTNAGIEKYVVVNMQEQSKGFDFYVSRVDNVKIPTDNSTQTVTGTSVAKKGTVEQKVEGTIPECNITKGAEGFMGCVAVTTYYLLFQPSSYLFALSGKLLDTTFAYSVTNSTYENTFIKEGWKVVRDICNMFFIFILLYAAFGLILSLNSIKTKDILINVILIGLFINFSLFVTQVVVDTSNILARVFYNSDSIKITENGATNSLIVAKNGGVLPISAAIVNKVNPQNLIINSDKVNVSSDTNGKADGASTNLSSLDAPTFLLVTLLATAINVVGFITFISIAFLFVVRVVGLWIAMIIVPFAFLSYTIPAMQNFEMIGWKKWWPETIKMAFLAPVFIFFMYIIIKFLDTGFSITQSWDELSGLNFVIAVTLPFIIIMVLMLKAKGIAKDMSGKLGEQITKAGASVAGAAVGLAAGGAGLLARSTLGRWGSSIGENEKLKAAEAKGGISGFMAGKLRNIGKAAGSGSFDVRNTAAMGSLNKVLKQTNTDLMIKQTKVGVGGFKKREADQKAKDIAKAKELELGENSKEKKDISKTEEEIQGIKGKVSGDLERLEKEIEAKRQAAKDAQSAYTSNKSQENKKALKEANDKLKEAQENKKKILEGSAYVDKDGNTKYHTTNGNITRTSFVENSSAGQQVKTSKEKIKSIESDMVNKENELQKALAELATANTSGTDAEKAIARSKVQTLTNEKQTIKNLLDSEKQRLEMSEKTLEDEIKNFTTNNGDFGKSIKELEAQKKQQIANVGAENARRRLDYAANITSEPTKWMRMFTSGFQYSTEGTNQAAHQIIMNTDVAAAGANQQR